MTLFPESKENDSLHATSTVYTMSIDIFTFKDNQFSTNVHFAEKLHT